jgi:hypothetical protein
MRLPRCLRRANRTRDSLSQPHRAPAAVVLDADSVKNALRVIPWQLRIPLVMVFNRRIPRPEAARRLRIAPSELEDRIKRAYRIFRIQMKGRGWNHHPLERVPPQTIPLDNPESTAVTDVPPA